MEAGFWGETALSSGMCRLVYQRLWVDIDDLKGLYCCGSGRTTM